MFHSATTQMSTMKISMLSSTHAIFWGLQDHLKDILQSLPDDISTCLRSGVIAAHDKLSEYYYKYDESPLYTWAAHKSFFLFSVHVLTNCSSVLDPRISYEGMQDDYTGDHLLADYLEDAKHKLCDHYNAHYANRVPSTSPLTVPTPTTASLFKPQGLPQKLDFTSRYWKKTAVVDELTMYFNLPWEDFGSCSPVKWWFNKCDELLYLFHLAHDILSIPGMYQVFNTSVCMSDVVYIGSAIAVERIFSGGCDIISLRHASLKPDTICVLMLVKHRLWHERAAIKKALDG